MKAFPQAQFRGDEPVDTEEHGGMDLRDHFAGLAMQGMINYELIDYLSNHKDQLDKFCELSFIIADKMMEARNDR